MAWRGVGGRVSLLVSGLGAGQESGCALEGAGEGVESPGVFKQGVSCPGIYQKAALSDLSAAFRCLGAAGAGGGYMRSMAVRMRRQKPVRLKWLWMPSQTKRR